MIDDRPACIEAQVLFADCRAPGPISASIGWKVKDVVEAPGSVPVGRSLLQAVDAIGQAYTPDIELARSDRSADAPPVLKQVRLDGDVMLLAQFADAGIDRTGRASHTMHGLLHDAPLRDPAGVFRRPVELLGSSMWLRPVGNDAVEAASVKGSRFDLPTGSIGLGDVIGDAFLTDLDRPERVALLPVVIEAFRQSLDEDATAVLVVPSPLESGAWFALISNLVDPVSAARMRFSTREELLSATSVDAWDYQLVAVVPSGLPSVRGHSVMASLGARHLVVDTARPPVENADGTWTMSDGSELRRSPWTELAETVLMSPVVTAGVRDRLDQLAAGVRGIDASPSWGLPVAALLAGADLPDGEATVRWIFNSWPTGAVVDDTVVDELVAALAQVIGESETLSTELSATLGPAVPEFLADAVIAGAVRRALTGFGAIDTTPSLSRPLSPAAADMLGHELAQLLGWVEQGSLAERLRAVIRVVRFGDDAGLRPDVVRGALRPTVDAIVRAIVDPGFDPYLEQWDEIPPDIWRDVFVDQVSDSLSVEGPDHEVSPATHEWLTPSLGNRDLPEVAAGRHHLDMSAYGSRRAAWQGSSADPWLAAAFAVGMMHVNSYRFSLPPAVAASRAMERAFAGHPIPVEVVQGILAVLDPAEAEARVAVAVCALTDGEFSPAQRRLATSLRGLLHGDFLRLSSGPVYLHLVRHLLVEGTTSAALQSSTLAAATYIGARFDEIEPPLLRAGVRIGLLVWGLRLPIDALRRVDGAPDDGRAAVTLRAAVPDTAALDFALQQVVENNDDAVLYEVFANLLLRLGLALNDLPDQAAHDPYVRYLSRRDDKESPLLLRGPVESWLADRGKPGYAKLEIAWDRAISNLVTRGWHTHQAYLESDRTTILDALQGRSVLGFRRSRR